MYYHYMYNINRIGRCSWVCMCVCMGHVHELSSTTHTHLHPPAPHTRSSQHDDGANVIFQFSFVNSFSLIYYVMMKFVLTISYMYLYVCNVLSVDSARSFLSHPNILGLHQYKEMSHLSCSDNLYYDWWGYLIQFCCPLNDISLDIKLIKFIWCIYCILNTDTVLELSHLDSDVVDDEWVKTINSPEYVMGGDSRHCRVRRVER